MQRRPKGSGSLKEESKGRWKLRVDAGADPVTGRRRRAVRTVRAANATEARKLLAELQVEISRQAPCTSATVRTVVEEWIRHIEARGRSPRTIFEARRSAESKIFPALGNVPVAELTVRHVDEWLRKMSTGEGLAQKLAPASARRHHAVLRAAIEQAVRWGGVQENVASRAEPPSLPQASLRIPTPDEVRRLIKAVEAENERWAVLIVLAALTGARRGELCALRWVDVEGSTIRIRRSLYRAGEERGEKVTKGGRERWVTLGPGGGALLSRWREVCEKRAHAHDVTLVDDAFLVSPLPDGSRPVVPDSLSSAVHRIARTIGMPHVHLHSLRHFAATELLAGGIDARNASEVLGHADGGRLLLSVYAHGTNERRRQAAETLERALMPSESSTASTGGGLGSSA
jgi:integrase